MIGARISAAKIQPLISLLLLVFGLLVAVKLGNSIASGDDRTLLYAGMACVLGVIALTIVKSWRAGFYFFLVWLLFEDLIRKFLGNNMVIYFAKDVLVGFTYLSFFSAMRREQKTLFRPPFLFWFGLFFWLAVAQAFNPLSPSVAYGLLGLKIYFYYFPLVFVGYALVRNEADLHKFLRINMWLACIIAGLGIAQSIIGPAFLNPQTLAPDIEGLSTLYRYAPAHGEKVFRPSSVFVSDGRFAWFLLMMWLVAAGALGFAILRGIKGRLLHLIYLGIGLLTVAAFLSGSRGTFVQLIASAFILGGTFFWGASGHWQRGHRLIKTTRRLFVLCGIAVFLTFLLYPKALGARWDFYKDTLSPTSQYSELGSRGWDYPLRNLELAFSQPHWIVGNGLGTASLGGQYVRRILKQPRPDFGVESGWGNLLLEVGVLGLLLWLGWTIAAVFACWKVTRELRQTPYFPLAFGISWFVFLLLIPMSYNGLDPFENYVYNAYLWILIGVLFRLPRITPSNSSSAAASASIC